MADPNDEGIRIQKVLARAGIASRRTAEIMVDEGRIEVNGEIVTAQGRRVDPERDVIRVDGARIPPPRRHTYLVFHKPRGVVCTMDDPQGRPTITDHLDAAQRADRLFHVGRLDTDTEGMLLLTNDGDFAQRMMHPSYELTKTYVAEVDGEVSDAVVARLRKGVRLEDGWVNPDAVRLDSQTSDRSMLTVVLHEGRNRIVRRLLAAVGYPVRRLSRTQIGPVRMGQLRSGELRELTRDELGALLDAVQL
ncbi:pseudouridine synthase [Propioniciclava soli]|uniref:pseudouridine synthase n=1 Tax=Propioniciclava soli TaxID=2775081 RepID=UPI001E4256BB|nr:pseudouridine synthase [Propioniciclava soli]